jgi:hypothetical protein
MRRRARTVLCGGRSAMVVPTATPIGGNSLSPRIGGFAVAPQCYGRHVTELGKSPCDRELRQAESTLIMDARI